MAKSKAAPKPATDESLQMQLTEALQALQAATEQLDELGKKYAATQTELALTVEANNVLSAELAKAGEGKTIVVVKNTAVPDDTFTFEGEEYGFRMARVCVGTQAITAHEVLADEKLQAVLVEKGSGMIYKK